jgi:hypothetical protein
MPKLRIIKLPIVCDVNGAATVKQSDNHVNGLLYDVVYIPGTLAAGTDLTITVQNSDVSKTILTLTDAGSSTLVLYPRGNACGPTGVVGTDGMQQLTVIGALQVVAAQGGAAGAGSLHFTVMEG